MLFPMLKVSEGYNIDGVNLTEGMRVLFTVDPILVKGEEFLK